jgi:hypothetical protein
MSDIPVFPLGEPIYFEGKPKERAYKAVLNRELVRDIACMGVNLLVFQNSLASLVDCKCDLSSLFLYSSRGIRKKWSTPPPVSE